jgi:RNA polymerase sigma-70 factor (ECF subfamily)
MNRTDFEVVVEEYGRQLYGYLLRFLANRDDAEDILQEVFISFYNRMDKVDPARYSSYLYRSAHNQAINFKKKKSRHVTLTDGHISTLAADSDNDPEAEAKNEKIRQALQDLKPKEMLAVELKYYQNKSYDEIAEIMGSTSRAVDSLLVRAKKKLRKKMQDFEN